MCRFWNPWKLSALTHVIATPELVPKCKNGILEQAGTMLKAASTASDDLELDSNSSLFIEFAFYCDHFVTSADVRLTSAVSRKQCVLATAQRSPCFLRSGGHRPATSVLPPASQRSIQLHQAAIFVPSRTCERKFGGVKRPLAVQHFQVGRRAPLIAKGRDANRFL